MAGPKNAVIVRRVATKSTQVLGSAPDAGFKGRRKDNPALGGVNSSVLTATETQAGKLEIATQAEVNASTAGALAVVASHTQPSSKIIVDRITGSTYSTLQHYINTMTSPGVISGGEITVVSATQVRVAAGKGMVRVADDDVSSLPFFDWAQTDFTIPADDVVRFFGVVYNSGAPIVEMRTAESWDKDREIALGSALHISSNGILVLTNPFKTGDPITNVIQRFDANAPVLRDSYVGGLIISNVGTRNIAISAGVLWHRLNDNPFAAFDSSGASRFTTVYYNGSAWVFTPSVAQWPNGQYNDVATGLAAITGARYVNLWFYIGATGNNVFMVYGQAQHVLLADALAEGEPSFFPTGTRPFVVLVGKLTFQSGDTTPTQLASPFTAASLGGGSVNTHNDLSGLQGGTTAQYYHLTQAAHDNISAGLTATPQFTRVGLGVAANSANAVTAIGKGLVSNNAANPTFAGSVGGLSTAGFEIQSEGGAGQLRLLCANGASAVGSIVSVQTMGGTFASPSGSVSGSRGGMRYVTRGSSAFSQVAAFEFACTETHSDTAKGTSFAISTTANGTASETVRLSISHDGLVGIGRTPVAKLDVAGELRTNANVSWDLGAVVTAASVFDTTRHVAVTIAGVAYKLALCT